MDHGTEPSSTDKRSSWQTAALLAVALLASVALIASVFGVPLLMSNDGPQAVFVAHVDAHFDDVGSIYPQLYGRGLGLSGRGFLFLFEPLDAALGWPTSLRVAQAAMLLAFAWGVAAVARATAGRFTPAALAGFVLAFAWPFYMGFYAYWVALAVGLWIIAFAIHLKAPSGVHKGALSIALALQVLLHPVAALATLAIVALVVLARILRKRGEPRRLALRSDGGWLLVTMMPHLAVMLMMRGDQTKLAQVQDAHTTEWAPFNEWVRTLPRIAMPGSTVLGWIVLALAALSLGRALAAASSRHARERPTPETAALTLAALGMLCFALAGPFNIPGWQFFAPRFLVFALALCFSVAPRVERPRAQAIWLAFATALVALGALNAARLNRKLATACADPIAGLAHVVPRTRSQLPIIFDSMCGLPGDPAHSDVPHLAPALHFGALIAARHGGTIPYVFSGPSAVHVLVPRPAPLPLPPAELWGLTRDDVKLTDPESRAKILGLMLLYGSAYENVLLFGASADDRRLLEERGYGIDFEQGSFINAHARPCRVELGVALNEADPPVAVSGGLDAEDLWTASFQPNASGATASFDGLCGRVWAKVTWQDNRQRCINADASGRIHLVARPGEVARAECSR